MIGSTNAMGGGGITSDETTVSKGKVLAGSTYLGADTNDEIGIGTMPDRANWSGSVPMNGSVTIPDGAHKNSKVNGPSVTQRGTPTYNLPINGTQNLSEGYYTGGKVTQSIATMGAQTLSPQIYSQTVSSSGKYMTGNVVINGAGLPPASSLKKGYRYWIGDNYVDGTYQGYTDNPLYFFNNGVWSNLQTTGMTATIGESSITPTAIRINIHARAMTLSMARLNQKVSLAGYKYLKAIVLPPFGEDSSHYVTVGISTNGNLTSVSLQAASASVLNNANKTLIADVTNFQGEYYIYLCASSSGNSNYIDNVDFSGIFLTTI